MTQKELKNLLERVESNYYEIRTQTGLIVLNLVITTLLLTAIAVYILLIG